MNDRLISDLLTKMDFSLNRIDKNNLSLKNLPKYLTFAPINNT